MTDISTSASAADQLALVLSSSAEVVDRAVAGASRAFADGLHPVA